MLRFLYGYQLGDFPDLRDSMFEHRAEQFKNRLNWDVSVDATGKERDEYDDLNPLYVIYESANGIHRGSMRFLPTTGRTMVNDHFRAATEGTHIVSPFIWECTRYCLAPEAEKHVSASILLGVLEVGLRFRLDYVVGVFDSRMNRVYRRLGWRPVILGTSQQSGSDISVGLWPVSESIRGNLERKTPHLPGSEKHWLELAMNQSEIHRLLEVA